MRKLLWIGDAGCETGFAKATHYILDTLRHYWEVTVLGLNYYGHPAAKRKYPYDIYPAHTGTDFFGVKQIPALWEEVHPDVVVIQNDPWNFPAYLYRLKGVPVVGGVAVDGLNCQGQSLNGLSLAVFWTEFGRYEASLGGYRGPSAVIPLGVDRTIYKPLDRQQCRREMGILPRFQDAFIVMAVGRNQLRKRLDLTIRYFAAWVKKYQPDNAVLYLHAAPTGEQAVDLHQLGGYYGVMNQMIVAEPEAFHGMTEERLPVLYNCADLGFSTSQGEGMGLPALEMMACGVTSILPANAAYSDWAPDGALLVPCTSTSITVPSASPINVIGSIMDEDMAVETLQAAYSNKAKLSDWSMRAFELASDPRFDWRVIGEKWNVGINEAIQLREMFKKKQEAREAAANA